MEQSLALWVAKALQKHRGIISQSPIQLEPLNGDAGLRQYFRVNTQPSLLAVSAPVDSGDSERGSYFAKMSEALRSQGVPTPQIIACDATHNFLLLEDFGDRNFLSELNDDSVDLLYSEALMVLLRMQQIKPESLRECGLDLPNYDQSLLREEMMLFNDWFVEKLLGKTLSSDERDMIGEAFAFLEAQACSQPQVLVHRDYHSRNIMYREGEAPGIIDFQDAVWGPITYDLVSLLRDCYIEWSPEQVERWLLGYGNLACELGLIGEVDEQQWRCWFDTMGLQRHIKVLGIFARLALRDNKPGYLHDLPLTWRYTVAVARQYPAMEAFANWCESQLLPVIEQQPWYQTSDDSQSTPNLIGEPA